MNRIGIGYDVHPLVKGREMWLGCVRLEDAERGLDGHSDADVVVHAVCDAILGAAGLGDIGEHFPDTDQKWKDCPGRVLLTEVSSMVGARGFQIGNIDCVVMADVIHLGARKGEMAKAMALHLEISPKLVNVKATTFEGHGAVGRGEVIACEAIALLTK
ncbi:MAG: 2-C-methyl-D-erythritol 2,4-cyclodiphosphate synthase [Candidatus Krumholzibacteriota bacterium]|nr:2-C-methyl-D-erythritol 2,4-cyclodiphosphate synthase [Candidatus Krumholzibacteriota bacterium]